MFWILCKNLSHEQQTSSLGGCSSASDCLQGASANQGADSSRERTGSTSRDVIDILLRVPQRAREERWSRVGRSGPPKSGGERADLGKGAAQDARTSDAASGKSAAPAEGYRFVRPLDGERPRFECQRSQG